ERRQHELRSRHDGFSIGQVTVPRYPAVPRGLCRTVSAFAVGTLRQGRRAFRANRCAEVHCRSLRGTAMTLLSDAPSLARPELEAYWMPFTANRQFKAAPRMLVRA